MENAMTVHELPLTLQTIYAELLDRCGSAAFDEAFDGEGNFTAKTTKGRVYWYFQQSSPEGRKQRYVGPDSPELQERIAKHRARLDDERERRTLVATLLRSGRLPRPLPEMGKVIQALAKAGVFRLRGVLVGTLAYQTYSALLGERLPITAVQTTDVDVAQFHEVSVAVEDTVSEQMLAILKAVDGSFRPIPDQRDGRRTHAYEATRGLRVEFLAPNRGPEAEGPASLPALGTDAQPLRFLDFLIYETEPALVLHEAGVYVRVPTAERYAVHKLIVARRRRETAVKVSKDLQQAESLLEVLLEKRLSAVVLAFNAAFERGPTWSRLLGEGLGELSSRLRDRVLQQTLRPRSIVPGLTLSFQAPRVRYDSERAVVLFLGSAGGETVRCVISREALDDHFDTDHSTPEARAERVRSSRDLFERMCVQKYLNWPVEEPNSVLIRTSEVERLLTEAGDQSKTKARRRGTPDG
jgi:hypothetical protein